MEMSLMALQAQEGFLLLKQVIGNCSMRVMTNQTVLYYRVMFKHEWPLVTGVAPETQVIDPFIGSKHTFHQAAASMGIVAV